MAQVGEKRVVIVPTRTVSAAGTTNSVATLCDASKYTAVILILNVTAQSGTTPTLDVYVQQELPVAGPSDAAMAVPTGTSVYNDLAHFTQVTTATGTWFASIVAASNANGPIKDGTLAAATVLSGPIGTCWRVKEIVAGTNPSYTYTLSAVFIP